MTSTDRIHGDLSVVDPNTAAEGIAADATILVSGFGSVGYPKAVPLALASLDRDLSLTIVSGGSVGEEIDIALVEADAITRRYPYQARLPIREATNDGKIAFNDRHIASLSDEVSSVGWSIRMLPLSRHWLSVRIGSYPRRLWDTHQRSSIVLID